MAIGGWKPAIWIDGNLEKGSSGSSNTFDNEPLTDENFLVKDIECWALDESIGSEMVENHPNSSLRSHDSRSSQEIFSQTYSRGRLNEECRHPGDFKFDDVCGSPFVDDDTSTDTKATARVRFRIGEEFKRIPSLSNLTTESVMSPDWTRSLHI